MADDYRTIVADPPWDYAGRGGGPSPGFQYGGRLGKAKPGTTYSKSPYPVMSIEEIRDLPVKRLAAKDAHLYLWTTNTHLRFAWDVCSAWGFRYSTLLVWAKRPRGAPGFPTWPCHTEFVVFARRGSLAYQTQAPTNWFQWPRGAHSVKPEAFLDLVEQVSPGPYLELFARRNRLGWDTWGNEALQHVSCGAGVGA